MRRGSRPWLALLLALTTSTGVLAVTPREALDAIDTCVRRLNPDIDTGYDRIVARCPNLARRLDESGLSVWLPRDWQRPGNDLSAGGLRELRGLLADELTSRPQRMSVPSVERVHAVLASLERTDPERSGWWGRTRKWLRDLSERRAGVPEEGWLTRMTGQSGLSQTVIELVSYAALALVVMLAIVIVANEMRVAGLLGGLRRRLAILSDVPGNPSRVTSSWEDVQRTSPRQRPGLLLEMLVARLVMEAGVRSPRGLTARELARAARLTNEADRGQLLVLAETAERIRFSNTQVPEEAIARAIEAGQLLLERIAAHPPGTAP
jgi:hypothetical protein